MAVLSELQPASIHGLYDASYYENDRKRYMSPEDRSSIWQRRLQLIESWRDEDETIPRLLDIGCGTGVFILSAKTAGWDSFGVEISPAGRIEAQKAVEKNKIFNDLFEVKNTSMFDVVSLWAVLEHIREPVEYLQKAKSLLKPNGILALSTPNTASLNRMLFGKRWRYFIPPEHLIYFNLKNLTHLLNLHQFEVFYSRTWFSTHAFKEGIGLHQKPQNQMLHKFTNCLVMPIKAFSERQKTGDTLELLARLK